VCLCFYSFNLKVTSFNVHGVKSSSNTIQDLCKKFDIILLQEHWLYPDDLSYISQLSPDFCSFSLSPMSIDDRLLSGRPHGGVSIMWRKNLSQYANIIQYDDNRILGLELKTNSHVFLFLSVYLPYECDIFYDDYCFYLNKIQCIIETASTPYTFVLGDFNANISSDSVFGTELIDFCDTNNLCFIDKYMLLPDSFTYISQAHGTTSWLDHCITTSSGQEIVSNSYIIKDIVCSDHLPLCIDVNCDISSICDTITIKEPKNVYKWNLATDNNKQEYKMCSCKFLSNIVLPIAALSCKDANCIAHKSEIDCFYNSILSAIKQATSECIPRVKSASNFHQVPGWNEYVQEHHNMARDSFKWWNVNNRPRHGYIYDAMRISRARFKYALRQVKHIEETARADSMARDFYDNDVNEFWKTVKKVSQCGNMQANSIDGISGEVDISCFWKDHYQKLLNNNTCDMNLKSAVLGKLNDIQYNKDMIVSATDISELIGKLNCGKSAGADNISAESLKFAHDKLNVLLSMCFSMCLSHGYLPPSMIETIIVPIVKNRCGKLSDSNNYRPIALATIISKVFESVILLKCQQFLNSSDNQFGFKARHSTDLCIYSLKEFIDFYKQRNTTVFVTFLDASKAFDRIDHWQLFSKLLDKHVPLFLIRLLYVWYYHQEMYVRWGNTFSSSFRVSNGVKQGGILSPVLFNIYMDKLSCNLNESGIGGDIGGILFNHLCYADDLCLVSLSSAGMQQLLNICNKYASEHCLLYNGNKSYSLCFKPKCIKFESPSFYLDKLKIPIVNHCKYLGIIVCEKNCDLDLKRQMRKLYANTNLLLRKFSKCSVYVKCYLFKAYCSNLYCSSVWFDSTKTAMNKLKIAYNNSLRRLLGIPKYNSASQMFVNHNVPSFGELLRKYVFSFMNRVVNSSNCYLRSIYNSSVIIYSKIWAWWYAILTI